VRHPYRTLTIAGTLLAGLALVAGDGGWWHRDWWTGAIRRQIDRLTPPPPLADMAGPACLRALAASGADYVRIADFATDAGCRVDAAVRVSGLGGAALSAPFVAACPLALALQRHAIATLAPAARAELGSPIVRIDHLGSFACRRVRGRPNGPLSQHAFARALDVTGYATADGRKVTLDADWGRTDAPAGRFLRRIVAGQSRWGPGWLAGPFTSVITPERDARHRDHIHFGLRPPRR
jgi:hypothetical protein